ncbi:N-acyl-D-amino-acid deacylase family protein [Panacagrimonas sp.]|uniref:N-acyl-D-amino-acid deacylase family protein n=1 Tax=Panacagrimonas sp. TaxID=2480088 RepID=UPI003B526048
MEPFDILIRNGQIIDGTGAEPYVADLAIKAGRIAHIAPRISGSATREIDATGKAVTPGFVDVHTHYDGQATWDSHMNPSSNLGTTTVVLGNCGVGFAPCRKTDREVLVQLMEGVEEIPGSALAAGIQWNWESFPDYLDALEAKPRDIDVAAFLPHAPLRVYVMGQRGVDREAATADDIAAMQKLVREAMDAGAIGFSSSRTLLHLSSTGESVPTMGAAVTEMKALGSCLSGDKGHVLQFISDWVDEDAEFGILRDVSKATGAKGTFTLAAFDKPPPGSNPNPDLWREHLKRIDAAQAEGLDIRGQVISRPIGVLMGHPASMSPFYRRPTFLALEVLPAAEKLAKLRDPAIKAQILSEQNDRPHIFVQLLERAFDQMYPMEEPINYLPANSDSVAARAQRDGRDPMEWLYDFLLGNDAKNLIYIPATSKNGTVIGALMQHPHTISALGDGGAHVGSICDSSANLFLITKWVRDEKLLSLAQGIRRITHDPASFFSLNDRGRLAPGCKADVNLLDLDKLMLKTPRKVEDLPGGGARFIQDCEGIAATFVAGEMIYREGVATGALPGRLVRSGAT